MSKMTARLLVAFSISLFGFAATLTWYNLTEHEMNSSAQSKRIARLVSATNEVQKKSTQRIIWQPVSENEILRVGEAIRTAANAEARIEFLETSTAIDLEPDSAIVLEESNGQLALDFLQGNILVKSDSTGSAGSSGLTLKSGDKTIALGQSELTLGKNKSGALDMQVLSGQVQGLATNHQLIKFKNYKPGLPFYVNPATNEPLIIEWEPLPAGYQVHLEAGTTRENMIPVSNAVAPGEEGQLKAQMKPGKVFLKLVARSTDAKLPEQTSTVIRAQLLSKAAPILLRPEKEGMVTLNLADPSVRLLWSNPSNYKKFVVEVAQSENLKTNLVRHDVNGANELVIRAENGGDYFWRVSGVLEGRSEVATSAIQKFRAQIISELTPPKLELPKNLEKIPESSIGPKGLALSWQASPSAVRYQVRVIETLENADRKVAATPKPIEHETQFLQQPIANLKPGTYQWTVVAVNSKNETSQPSETRTFTIREIPTLPWADGKDSEEHYYLSLKPSMPLKWEKGDPNATKWIVKIMSADSPDQALTKTVSQTSSEVEVPNDGRYFAVVEAYNDRNQILARSIKREMKVISAPLLPAPQFAEHTPTALEASNNGQINIAWREVDGAKKYVVKITPTSGGKEREYDSDTLNTQVRDLMPGEYKLTLRSVDSIGRKGPEGEQRTLKVPNQSNVRAPKLKGVKFK